MKSNFLLLILFISNFVSAQNQDTLLQTVLSPAEMQEDFRRYRRLLEETHPGLYRYQSKEKIQAVFDGVGQSLDEPMAFYDFYQAIATMNVAIRCAHSNVIPTKKATSYLSHNIKIIPFYFFTIDQKPIVLFNGTLDQTIKPGFELLEVNGTSVDSILSAIRKYKWADGNFEPVMPTGAFFWLFYYLFIERPDSFHLVFQDLDGEELSIDVPAQSYSSVQKNFNKNSVNKEMTKKYNKKIKRPWKLVFPKDSDGSSILRFYSFGGRGMNNEEDAQKEIRKFMDASLKKIAKKKSTQLIVDLRDNGGGWDIQAIEILSYLFKNDTTFLYYAKAIAVTDSTEFFQYSDLTGYTQEQIKAELTPNTDGTFSLNKEQNIDLQKHRSKEKRFQGDIYFLINKSTGSAAAELAALAKSHRIGTFIGAETNGAYEGGNGSTFIRLPLPNSGIMVQTPLVAGYLDVRPVQEKGRGVLPDYEVAFTVEDLLLGFDRQTEFVKDLIKGK